MPHSSPLHDATWARQLADKLGQEGIAVHRILRDCGIDPGKLALAEARLPFSRLAQFFERAALAARDEYLGLHFGQTRDMRDVGLLGYLGLASPTLRDAISNIARYRRVVSEAVIVDVSQLARDGHVSWHFRTGAETACCQFAEFFAANLLKSFRTLTRREIVPQRVCFAHPRLEPSREIDSYFGVAAEHGSGQNALRFRLADLETPVMTSDDRLLNVLRGYCEEVLSRRGAEVVTLVEQVERELAGRLGKGDTRIDEVANALGMSRRTLSRRLADANTSFNEVQDTLRRALAQTYLTESKLALTEIAYLVGYAEVSSFNTAFKRWTGESPGQYRKNSAPGDVRKRLSDGSGEAVLREV